VQLGIAIDIGGSHATCALVDERRVLRKATAAVDEARLQPMLDVLEETTRRLLEEERVAASECAGVSVAFPGIVDDESGRVLGTLDEKFADAVEYDLRGWGERSFGVPLRVENDARLALLGEWWCGAAKGFEDVVMVTLGTGIGGAAMTDGRLLSSTHHQAGAIGGHIPVTLSGRRCLCGGHGCAEAEASSWALPEICAEQTGFAASSLAGEPTIDFRTLFQHNDAGDAVAAAVLEHCCRVWATLTVALINAYDPEVVVFGGAVMSRSESILPRIQAAVDDRAWTPGRKVRIARAELADDAPLYGAIPFLGLSA
jgi:glucokinase